MVRSLVDVPSGGWVSLTAYKLGTFLSVTKGNGGSVTINNVQGIGQQQWVSLYYANGVYQSPGPPDVNSFE